MNGLDLNQFAASAVSTVSGLLTAPARRVSEESVPPAPAPEPTPYVNPFRDEPATGAGGTGASSFHQAPPGDSPQQRRPYGYDPAQDEYIPLTEEELDAKTEARVEMIAAFIAIITTIINAFFARQKLEKGDKELIRKHNRARAETGNEPVYKPNHPYHAARARFEQFEADLKEIEEDAKLSDAQKNLLFRAVYASMKAKDLQRRLRNFGMVETVGEIALIKITENAMSGLIALSTRSFR